MYVSRKPGMAGWMETFGILGKWLLLVLSLAFCYVCIYCSTYFTDAACDIPASGYLMVLGITTCFLCLVELYNMCAVNKRDAYAPLDSQKQKGSKIVSIGRMVFGLGLFLSLIVVNISVVFSKTCRRTSGETAALKLNSIFFRTLYQSIVTATVTLDLALLIFLSSFCWTKYNKSTGEREADDTEEKQHLMETTRAGMEAHHAKT